MAIRSLTLPHALTSFRILLEPTCRGGCPQDLSHAMSHMHLPDNRHNQLRPPPPAFLRHTGLCASSTSSTPPSSRWSEQSQPSWNVQASPGSDVVIWLVPHCFRRAGKPYGPLLTTSYFRYGPWYHCQAKHFHVSNAAARIIRAYLRLLLLQPQVSAPTLLHVVYVLHPGQSIPLTWGNGVPDRISTDL